MNKMSLGVSLLVLTGVLYSYNAVATALIKLRWAFHRPSNASVLRFASDLKCSGYRSYRDKHLRVFTLKSFFSSVPDP
jgi:hypothetical protein